jgi:hypothetical protein
MRHHEAGNRDAQLRRDCVFGLPAAIVSYLFEKRREREIREDEAPAPSDNYQDFFTTCIENPDLRLFLATATEGLSDEQQEKMFIIFSMLISLFERAYVLMYEKRMSRTQQRRWTAWEDYMREWYCREDFRRMLPTLLSGEDAEFAAYIEGLGSR